MPAAVWVGIVLAVIVAELLALAAIAALGRRPLARRMLPGACAGLFLTLALREALHGGGALLALWLAGAGVAHSLDWWQAARKPPARVG
jgi:hypothetical protein